MGKIILRYKCEKQWTYCNQPLISRRKFTCNFMNILYQCGQLTTNVSGYDDAMRHSWCRLHRIWQYGLWSFQAGGTRLERFLYKNQHTQRKLLNFEFWINGELSKSAKIWLSKSIFYVKNHPNLSHFLFIEEYQFKSTLFVIDIFW